jgi:hypothetical protein
MQESEFHEMADEFTSLAHELSEQRETSVLGAAFLYAVARYNTFFYYKNEGSLEDLPSAVEYYCEQYKQMLMECMREFDRIH